MINNLGITLDYCIESLECNRTHLELSKFESCTLDDGRAYDVGSF